MPRALPGTVGILLAIAVILPASKAPAQILSRFRRQQIPAQKGRFEVDAILSDERQRLAEMKVELALLGDIATFPYDFAARANGNTLELRGNVPNEMVRQRAIYLARHSTFLRGIDALTIQPKLSVRSTLRPSSIVQQEGMDLLHKELGAAAKQMALESRPNGIVVLTGRTDCVESKVEISRLFRRLPGCTAVINELTIEPIALNGQSMVRVTRNNMLLVPPSSLGQELEPFPTSAPAAVQMKPRPADQGPSLSPQPRQIPAPAPLRTSSLDAREGELHLPSRLAMKPSNDPSKAVAEKGDGWEAFAPSKLPVKWGRPGAGWDAQAKDLETVNSPRKPAASQMARQQPQSLPKPAKSAWTPQTDHAQNETPSPIRMVDRPGETTTAQASTTASGLSRANAGSRLNSVETRTASEQAMTWRRPSGSEESEPRLSATTPAPRASASSPSSPLPDARGAEQPSSSTSPIQSSRRWPSAYVMGPPPSQGRAGVISFDDELPAPKPAPTVIATSRSLAPAELQRQIKSLCGRQAREVVAAVQNDGIVLVRVKVANRIIEDQLSRKILSLPEMSSPRVRLMMEIEP